MTLFAFWSLSPAPSPGTQQEWKSPKDAKPVLFPDTAFLAWDCSYKLVGDSNLYKTFLKQRVLPACRTTCQQGPKGRKMPGPFVLGTSAGNCFVSPNKCNAKT